MIPPSDSLNAVGTVEIIGRSGVLERFGELDGYFGTAPPDSRIVNLFELPQGVARDLIWARAGETELRRLEKFCIWFA